MLRIVGCTLIVLLFTACAPTTLSGGPSAGHLRADSVPATRGEIPPPVQQSTILPRPKARPQTETYSVVVNNVRVQDLLFALARDARLNVDVHPGISGTVTLNAIDQTLPQLLVRISKQVDMRYELDGPNLAVMPDTPYLKSYKVDYVNISRDVTGTISTNTQISTSALSTTGGGGSSGSGNTSRLQIENKSKNRFWESLEKNIKEILQDTDKERIIARKTADTNETNSRAANASATAAGAGTVAGVATAAANALTALAGTGNQNAEARSGANQQGQKQQDSKEYETIFASSVISNTETGVLSVRATSRQHEKVQEFIDKVSQSAKRQVLIEATIVEVTLADGYQQGITWQNLAGNDSGFRLKGPSTTSNVPSAVEPYTLTYINKSSGLSIALDMLKSYGTVKVLSSPKLTVLNNQTATLKVSEDYVYFNVKSDTTTTSNVGTTVGVTTTPQSVSVGFFMSLTAQISDGDTVTLNVRPSISSISELKRDPNPIIPTTIPNYVPQIRTREIESMMRVESGEIAVLGGLMEDRMDNKNGRFPILGDVPLFGEIFNTRNNAATKTELVVFIRPTVIKDASVNGDFGNLRSSLPGSDFFRTDDVYVPFGGLNSNSEPRP